MISTRQSIFDCDEGLDIARNANWVHKFGQATGALGNLAEVLAAFRRSLIEEGFAE